MGFRLVVETVSAGLTADSTEGQLPGGHRKHVPLRTCIICQQKRPKRELIRIVRTPEGVIEPDSRGKLSGRGAYCCPSRACWEAALEPVRLGRVLKCRVSAEDVVQLYNDVSTAAKLLRKREVEAGLDESNRARGGGR